MDKAVPVILGAGYALPAQIRTNDDPIFDWIKANNPIGEHLFTGYKTRHILHDGEPILTIMKPAVQQALAQSNCAVADIDIIIGAMSIGEYINPSELTALHRDLGFPKSTWVVPINGEFSQFNAAILMAHHLLLGGAARNILICVGGSWSKNVDYHTPQSVSAADGAAAIVMGLSDQPNQWTFVDWLTIADSSYYGSMYTGTTKIELSAPQEGYDALYTNHSFYITELGLKGFKAFGEEVPPQAALQLLSRQGVKAEEVTLISHQASSVLMNNWQKAIQPRQYINTIEQFANMAPANIPVNFAWSHRQQMVHTPYLLLLAIGPDMHTNAVLMRRTE